MLGGFHDGILHSKFNVHFITEIN